MGNTHSDFHYEPLRSEHNEIRLLRLRSKLFSRFVSCEIQNFSLHECPPFIALSYTWGDPAITKPILLNSQRINITANLESFLRHARADMDAPGSRDPNPQLVAIDETMRYAFAEWDTLGHFWCDALCIDQSNIPERSAQVLKMKDIYEHARKIIVWLGPASDGSSYAMERLRYLARIQKKHDMVSGSMPMDPEILGPVNSPFPKNSWGHLEKFMGRTWWGRAWILQEATTPEREDTPTAFWCGKERIDWKTLYLANISLCQGMLQGYPAIFGRLLNPKIIHLDDMRSRRQDPSKTGAPELLNLLGIVRYADASDKRDKLYSILALATDGNHPNLQPDYSLPVVEVYRNLAVHLLTRNNRLEVLAFCFCEASLPGLPTWVPDWSLQSIPSPFPKRFAKDRGPAIPVYRADAGKSGCVKFSDDMKRLVLRGFEFDSITSVSEPRTEELARTFRESRLARQWSEMALAGNPLYVGGSSKLDALQHTLCVDVPDDAEVYAQRGKTVNWPAFEDGREDYAEDIFNAPMILQTTTIKRRLIFTSSGHMGIGPMYAEPGDKVCILFGSQVPMILRPEAAHFLLIGECYVHGIMDGEAFGKVPLDIDGDRFEIW